MTAEPTRPTYGNWRLPARPGIGPLGLTGTVLLLGGLILALLTALVSWAAAIGVATAVAPVTVPLAIRTADGRSGFTVAAARLSWLLRRLTAGTGHVAGPLAGRGFRPPGLLTPLRCSRAGTCMPGVSASFISGGRRRSRWCWSATRTAGRWWTPSRWIPGWRAGAGG